MCIFEVRRGGVAMYSPSWALHIQNGIRSPPPLRAGEKLAIRISQRSYSNVTLILVSPGRVLLPRSLQSGFGDLKVMQFWASYLRKRKQN